GDWSVGWAIDDQNNVVGDSRLPGNLGAWDSSRAFRYIDAENRMQNLNDYAPPGWVLHTAHATNGDEIVGYGRHDGQIRAYRLTLSNGRVDDLGTFTNGISYA